MKLAVLLPYKEEYSPNYSGAVSIHVSNLFKHSVYKKNTYIYGNTNKKKYLSKNFINIKVTPNLLTSNNKKYLSKFIEINKKNSPDIIEVHNRPSYVNTIKLSLKSKIILYFHNDPLTLSGSKSTNERLDLLEKCDFIFFNSKWTKKQFFNGIDEKNYEYKFNICFQSTQQTNVNFKKKEKIISFVGKLNSAKGYDIFGKALLKILDEFPDWKAIVVGDEPREKHIFVHKNLKIYNFKDNNFVLNVLKKTSIFVACSKWEEPFGRSSLEACSLGCATIITRRGGLTETTNHPIILKKLDPKNLYFLIKKIIKNSKIREEIQKLNYKSFYLTHEYVSNIIDTERKKILSSLASNKLFIQNKSHLKIFHITNFNQRYFGRLQYNTGIRINNGFIKEGHNVLSLSDRDLVSYSKSFTDPTGGKFLNKLVDNTVHNFKPDIIVLGHADKVSRETLFNVKKSLPNTKICQWFLDPLSKHGPDYLKNKTRVTDKSDLCDASFITTSPDVLDFHIENSFYIPNPCDKSIDYLENFKNNNDFDLFYAISHGVHRGILRSGKIDEREKFILKLKSISKDIKFDLYGMFGKQPVWGDVFLEKLSNSLMALNLSRGKPVKYYSSDRIAQLMGNGLLTFIHKDTKYSDFFDNNEMIFYNNVFDLSEKIKKYKKDKSLSKKIAKNGHTKYHKFFNSSLIAKFMIDRTYGKNSNYLWDK